MMGSGLGSRILDADFRMKDAGSKMPNLSQFRNIVETMFFVCSGICEKSIKQGMQEVSGGMLLQIPMVD